MSAYHMTTDIKECLFSGLFWTSTCTLPTVVVLSIECVLE